MSSTVATQEGGAWIALKWSEGNIIFCPSSVTKFFSFLFNLYFRWTGCNYVFCDLFMKYVLFMWGPVDWYCNVRLSGFSGGKQGKFHFDYLCNLNPPTLLEKIFLVNIQFFLKINVPPSANLKNFSTYLNIHYFFISDVVISHTF